MFQNRKSKQQTYLNIWYEGGAKNKRYGLGEIPIKEEIIIEKSMTFFNDPEPCYIHRGAVVIRLNEEILEAFKTVGEDHLVEASSLNKEILGYIELPDITSLMINSK